MQPLYPSHPGLHEEQRLFREARRDGIYSTDSAAILGLSRWGSPLSVYLDKTEPPEPQDVSLQAWLGWRLEDPLAALWTERFPDLQLERFPEDGAAHPRYPWLRTHGDFWTVQRDLLVECKSRSFHASDWGEDRSSAVPVDVWVQCQHEMLVTGIEACHVAVLFGFTSFHHYEIAADAEFQRALVPQLLKFWIGVQGKTPPPLTAHRFDTGWTKRHRQTEAGMRSATPEQESMIRLYQAARRNHAQTERAKVELENKIRELIGPAEGIEGMFGKITYRKDRDSIAHHWDTQAGIYRQAAEELLEMAAPGDDEALVARLAHIQQLLPNVPSLYEETVPGSRRFNFQLIEEEES